MLYNYRISLDENVLIDPNSLSGIGQFTVYDADTNELYCYLTVHLEGNKSTYTKYEGNDLIIKKFAVSTPTRYIFNNDKAEFMLFLNNHLQSTRGIKCDEIQISYQNGFFDERTIRVNTDESKRCCSIL